MNKKTEDKSKTPKIPSIIWNLRGFVFHLVPKVGVEPIRPQGPLDFESSRMVLSVFHLSL